MFLTARQTSSASRSSTGGSGRRHEATAGYLFVAPFLLVFTLFFVSPLLYAAYLSLFRHTIVGGDSFAGLANFTRAIGDPNLQAGVVRMAEFFFVQVPFMLVLSLLAALAIDSALLRGARVFRIGIFIPYAVPAVVATLMWGYLYGPDFGPFAQLFNGIGLPAPDFLGPTTALFSMANVVTWEYTGYNMIILYTTLRAIDRELYEAAAIDGATAWQTAWSIKIPMLRPALTLCLLFSVIGSFQLFAEPQLLSRLAPTVIDSAYTPNVYAYTLAFTSQSVNYAAAVSFLVGIVIVIASYSVLFVINRAGRQS